MSEKTPTKSHSWWKPKIPIQPQTYDQLELYIGWERMQFLFNPILSGLVECRFSMVLVFKLSQQEDPCRIRRDRIRAINYHHLVAGFP